VQENFCGQETVDAQSGERLYRIMMSISVPSGELADISKLSFFEREAEIIVPINSRLRIDSHADLGNGLIMVQLTLVDSIDPVIPKSKRCAYGCVECRYD